MVQEGFEDGGPVSDVVGAAVGGEEEGGDGGKVGVVEGRGVVF